MKMNRTERYIYNLLTSISIDRPDQLTINNIASAFNLTIRYWKYESEAVFCRGIYKVFIKEGQTALKQWIDFCHEFGHINWHVGLQEELPTLFYQLQEDQANYFAYHLAIPTFMLERIRLPPTYIDAIRLICNTFNVEPSFAATRLEMYKNKQLQKIMNF